MIIIIILLIVIAVGVLLISEKGQWFLKLLLKIIGIGGGILVLGGLIIAGITAYFDNISPEKLTMTLWIGGVVLVSLVIGIILYIKQENLENN